MNRVKIYVCHRMTGRYCHDLLHESRFVIEELTKNGYDVLDPIMEEKIPDTYEILKADPTTLEKYWKRDKEMIRDADVVLDYLSGNQSDGANKELGYARYCLWKPTIRIVPTAGFGISRLEDDIVVETLNDALLLIGEQFGTYEKLRAWRRDMWTRCFKKWLDYQHQIDLRYQNALPEQSR